MLFTVSTVALAFALQGNNFLTVELGALSTAALLLAVIGMVIGQRIRKIVRADVPTCVFHLTFKSCRVHYCPCIEWPVLNRRYGRDEPSLCSATLGDGMQVLFTQT